MAVGVASKDRALAGMLGGTLSIGLFRLSMNDEETDPAYSRQSVRFGQPEGDDIRYVSNAEEVAFPPYRTDADRDVTMWGVFDTQGQVVVSGKLLKARSPSRSDHVVFRRGDLRVGIT
jgi:hypothetical protein